MDQHPVNGNAAKFASLYERVDSQQHDVVNHGISVLEARNTMSAVEYLKSHGVAGHVIERVLLEPGRRRSSPSDW